MKKLEKYILENVKINDDIEYPLLAFRVITHVGKMAEYTENTLIRESRIYHNVFLEDLEIVLGSYMMLAMQYVSNAHYIGEFDNIIVLESKENKEIPVEGLLAHMNSMSYTASEIINNLSQGKENEFYISQLIIDGIKHVYTFCEFAGINIEELRSSIYKNRTELLRTTTRIIKEHMNYKLPEYLLIDIVMKQGKYSGLNITKDLNTPISYTSGNIIKDFFECTKILRDKDQRYKYSSKLYEYFDTEKSLKHAYIQNGALRFSESMPEQEIKEYRENIDKFETTFHHIIVHESVNTMDDFLEYLYLD